MENNNMEAVFAGAAVVDQSVSTEKDEAKQIKQAMVNSFKVKISSDPDFASKVNTACGNLSVETIYKFGDSGNIKVDHANSTKDERVLVACGKPVGYGVKNIGPDPIAYTTEEFAADATDTYVGTVVEKTIAPGETVILSRKYLAMLVSRPEFGMKLANGSVVASAVKAKANPDKILSQSYFNFSADAGKTVNDDDISVRIDVDGKVTDEFVTVFGSLNNPKPQRTRKAAGEGGRKFTTQDYVAHYIQEMLAQNGRV
jgi:hypothetical protein